MACPERTAISSIYSNIYPTRCNVTQFIYIWKLLYVFRVVSSGAHTTVCTASGICHAVTAICRYRGRAGTGLSVHIYIYIYIEISIVKKIYNWKPLTSRAVGRPKQSRWEDDVRNYLKQMKLIQWTGQVQERLKWKAIVDKNKTVSEL